MDITEPPSDLRARLGAEPAGVYASGNARRLAAELLRLIVHGPKRATGAALAEVEQEPGPFPEPGQYWIIPDDNSRPGCVIRVEDVRIGPLYTVDAAFAWEEGEGDRTRRRWLEAQERSLHHQGVEDLASEPMVFQRFSVIWPAPDEPRWWAPGVREVRGHEPLPDSPRPDLPALAAFDGGEVRGLLRFEPEAEDLRLVSLRTDDPQVEARLRAAFQARRAADRGRV